MVSFSCVSFIFYLFSRGTYKAIIAAAGPVAAAGEDGVDRVRRIIERQLYRTDRPCFLYSTEESDIRRCCTEGDGRCRRGSVPEVWQL